MCEHAQCMMIYLCGGLKKNRSPQVHIFECLVISGWHYLRKTRRIRRCDLVEG